MQYLKIRNRGATPRGALEFIGFTTKRDSDDPDTVGVKGSGAKLAAIAAMRRNILLWVTSVDTQGSYSITHKTRAEHIGGRIVRRIVYTYASGAEVYTNLLEDSFHDWDKPVGDDPNSCYPILREFIANAYDADREFTISVVDDQSPDFVAAREDETIVYIEYSPEFEAVLQEPSRYFKFLAKVKPLFTLPGVGDIYPKSDPKLTRMFVRGVLRRCSEVSPSAFDYSIQDRSAVSEEGLLRIDTMKLFPQLAKLVCSLDDVELAKAIIVSALAGGSPAEGAILCWAGGMEPSEKAKAAFKRAWKAHFGDTAIIGGASPEADLLAKTRGLTVVPVSFDLVRMFLQKCGIPSAQSLVMIDTNETVDVPVGELPPELQERATRAWNTYLKQFPDAKQLPFSFFRAPKKARCSIGGHSGAGFTGVWLNVERLEDDFREVLSTIVHEHRHCRTKKPDNDFGFWNPTDGDVADAIIRAEKLDPETGEQLPKKT